MFSASSGYDQVQPSRHLLGQSPQTTTDGTAVAPTIAATDDAADTTAVDAADTAADATADGAANQPGDGTAVAATITATDDATDATAVDATEQYPSRLVRHVMKTRR